MQQSTYREQDHVFGQLILKLRMAIRLTQTGLADILRVSRRAVGSWEAGESYPKATHLQHFITLLVEQRALTGDRGAEEIRALWRAARQKILLDENWLATLLAEHPAPARRGLTQNQNDLNRPGEPLPRIVAIQDWGDAPGIPVFHGRDAESAQLTEWIVAERSRLVCVVGMGGIGKSALAATAMRSVAAAFDVVIWRSLSDAPACEGLLDSCLEVLDPHGLMSLPDTLDARLRRLMEQLRNRRVLLVLDNWDALLEEGVGMGRMRAGFAGYARLLRQIAECAHQSCLLLTAREKPIDLALLEGYRQLVRVLKLGGLDLAAGTQLLAEKALASSAQERATLIELYSGNPLALKIVAQAIIDVFAGDPALFLAQGNFLFGGVRHVLDEQFNRLSTLERNMVYWLAILREPVTLEELLIVLRKPQAPAHIMEALDRLNRRSMIERGQRPGSFTLHSVVFEYAIAQMVAEASSEVIGGRLDRLIAHGFSQARAKDYSRKAQEQLLLLPILRQLCQAYPEPAGLERRLRRLLEELRGEDHFAQGYGPANLLALLQLLRGDLRGLDLSELMLRGVFLPGVTMQDTVLSAVPLQDSVVTEAFAAI